MKNIFSIAITLTFCLNLFAVEPIFVNAPVNSVTVFTEGANVKRVANLNLKKGVQTIIFYNLPVNLEQNRIFASTEQNVRIISINNVSAILTERMKKTLSLQSDSIADFTKNLTALKRKKIDYDAEYILIKNTQHVSTTLNTAIELEKLANFYRLRLHELTNLILDMENRIQISETDLNNLNMRKNNNLQLWQNNSSAIKLTVKANDDIETNISIFYYISNASWQPHYNFRFNGLTSPCDLELNATIYNQTSDLWKNAKITLSTAQPQRNLEPSPFYPVYLNEVIEKPRTDNYYQIQNSSAMNSLSLKSLNKDDLEDIAQISSNELTVSYELDEPLTIGGDDASQNVLIKTFQTTPNYSHTVNISSCNDVYFMARITGWQSWRLLNGPINVYNYGELNGVAQLNTYLLSDTLKIPLGIDKNIIIKYKNLIDKKDKQLLSDNYKHEFLYEISIKNNNAANVQIELVDQIPISNTDKIKIELTEKSGAIHDIANGKITWNFALDAKSGTSKKLGFIAKYPKNEIININDYKIKRM